MTKTTNTKTPYYVTATKVQILESIAAIVDWDKTNTPHRALMSAVHHCYRKENGDTSLIMKVVVALFGVSGTKKAGMEALTWLQEYFPIRKVVDDEGNLKNLRLNKNWREADWRFAEADTHPHDQATKAEKIAYMLDMAKLVRMIDKAASRTNKTDGASECVQELSKIAHAFADRQNPDEATDTAESEEPTDETKALPAPVEAEAA